MHPEGNRGFVQLAQHQHHNNDEDKEAGAAAADPDDAAENR
jgi:hypothetical protein